MAEAIRVLMVEDNRGDVVLMQEAIRRAGVAYRVSVIQDGVEAVEYLLRRGRYAGVPSPDLIVLDLKIPRKGGREVLADIHADEKLGKIPVVILSSSVSELELARAQIGPSQACMPKPTTFPGYVDMVLAIEAFRLAVGKGKLQGS